MGRIPPEENHPRYQEWLQASIRHLKAAQNLKTVPQDSPDFAGAQAEWLEAKRVYEALLEQLV